MKKRPKEHGDVEKLARMNPPRNNDRPAPELHDAAKSVSETPKQDQFDESEAAPPREENGAKSATPAERKVQCKPEPCAEFLKEDCPSTAKPMTRFLSF